MFLLLKHFSLLVLILGSGCISFTGSDSRDKMCFFGTGFKVRVCFFGSGFSTKVFFPWVRFQILSIFISLALCSE